MAALIKFISLGDWGNPKAPIVTVREKESKGSSWQGPVTQAVAKRIHQLTRSDPSLQFLAAVGDNFYENGVMGLPPRQGARYASKGMMVYPPSPVGVRQRMLEGMKCTVQRSDHKVYEFDPQPGGEHVSSQQPGICKSEDALWDTVYFNVHRSVDAPATLPWYVCLGNHDYRGLPQAQVEYTYHDPTGLWNMPSAYYRVTYTMANGSAKLHCIFIDTYMLCRRHSEHRARQKKWILEQLRQCTASSGVTVVFGHYPLASNGAHCSKNLNVENTNVPSGDEIQVQGRRTIKNWLIRTLMDHGVDLYVSGHNHLLEHITLRQGHQKLECIVSGSGSKLSKRTCGGGLLTKLLTNFRAGQPSFGLGYGFVVHSVERDDQGHMMLRHQFHYLAPRASTKAVYEWQMVELTTRCSRL